MQKVQNINNDEFYICYEDDKEYYSYHKWQEKIRPYFNHESTSMTTERK